MSEPEKDFESFREGHRQTSGPSGKDAARQREDAPDFGSFKADLDAYVVHWNTRCRQVKPKGPTPEELQSQSLVA